MANTQIGRADYALGADQTQLVKDLASAESKINASGAHMQGSALTTGNAFKAGAAVAAVGFGLMSKGALDMEEAQGKYQAATGASAEVSKQFAQDMNGLVGNANTVKDSFQQITAAGTEVSSQFQIQGKDATELTNAVLGYAKVTGSDGVIATDSLHSALSAYNLTSADAQGLMDQLVLSHQRFGTQAGPQTLDVLSKMAPALQAMNMGTDDGIALLNLFQQSGLDSSKAATALQFAVKQLKPGQDLNDLIKQIGSIQDPTERAQASMKLFGVRAGTGLANAIKPGMTSLSDFTVSAEDAAGATDKASESMDTTEEKIQMFAQKAGAALRGFGADFGPVLTGAAGMLSLVEAMPNNLKQPFEEAFKGIAGAASKGIKAIGSLAGDAIRGIAAKIIPQAAIEGTAVGVAEGEAEAEASAGTGMVQKWISKFASMTGLKVAAAAAAGTEEGVAEGEAAAAGMGGASAVSSAGAAGTAVGGGFMATLAPILAIGAAGVGVIMLPAILDHLTGQDATSKIAGVGTTMADKFAQGYSDEVKAGYATVVQKAYNDSLAAAGPFLTQANYDAASKAALAAGTGFLAGFPADYGTTLADEFGSHAAWAAVDDAVSTEADSVNANLAAALQDAKVPQEYVQWLMDNTNAQLDAKGKLVLDPLSQQLIDWSKSEGELTGAGVSKGIADALLNGDKPVSDALYAMMNNLPAPDTALSGLYEKLNVPQALAVQWSSSGAGFDLGKALQAVISDAGKTIPKTLADSVMNAGLGPGYSHALELLWGVPTTKAATTTGQQAGAAADKAFGSGLIANSGQVTQAADKVKQDLANALTPSKDAVTAAGAKTIKLFQDGIKSQDETTRTDAAQLGINSLSALEKVVASGKGSAKDAKAIGVYFDTLVASGMDSKAIAIALAADGVGADAIAKLTGYYPLFDASGKAYDARLASGITQNSGAVSAAASSATTSMRNLDTGTWGYKVGDAWITGFSQAVRGGAGTIAAAIAKATRATAGSSPPKEGPLMHIDQWGYNVGKAWNDGLVKGLGADALTGLLNPDLGSLSGLGAPATMGGMSLTVGDINVTVEGASGDPQAVGAAVADQVRGVIDDVLSTAMGGTSLRWSEASI